MNRHLHLFMLGLPLWIAPLISAPALAEVVPAAASQAAPAPPTPAPAPRVEAPLNPGLVYQDRMLTEDTVWRGEVLVEGVVTVAPQATLNIEPGTVIRFRQKGAQAPLLVVQGRVVATGTRENPIRFGSGYQSATPGDWQGIMLLGSEKKNQMENCRIEGAQVGLDAIFSNVTLKNVLAERSGMGIRLQDSLLVMDGGGASNCDTGLSFSESETTLRNMAAVGNRIGISARRSSIYLLEGNLSGNSSSAFSGDGCRIKIQGGAFLENGSGVTLLGCQGSLSAARLVKNRGYGVSLTSSRVRVTGNQVSGNGEHGIMVFDGASAAWDNVIFENAGYDLYNAGTEEFRAPGNWWGTAPPKIFDNNGRGKVLYAPVLAVKPAPQQGQ